MGNSYDLSKLKIDLVKYGYIHVNKIDASLQFAVRGDILDIYSVNNDYPIRIEFFGDEIESIKELDPLTGEIISRRDHISIFPASHYATSKGAMQRAVVSIEEELKDRLKYFRTFKYIKYKRIFIFKFCIIK